MEPELLIDAMYINNSGGKILLDYLIVELEKSGKKVFYLLDKRVEDSVPYLKDTRNEVLFLEGSIVKRHFFYRKFKDRFSSVLCFGDLPPNIRLKAKVFTYFHQQLYIKVPKDTPTVHKIMFSLKRMVLRFLFKNTDYWILQTDVIKKNFQNKYHSKDETLLILPYFPEIKKVENVTREKNSFVFISSAPPHKNHVRLINAFCAFYDENKSGKLIITVSEDFAELCTMVQEKKQANYPIENIGFVDRDSLGKIYQSCEFLIFPSLAESFGLGIVEAIENGCKVIGADLPYIYAVCEPTLTFDPLDENSIKDAFSYAVTSETKMSKSLVENNIKELIEIL
ncbi:glycosyltransferase [Halpernia frigidisoli]|uniref:Glycosyl transferases group 1 n=1 Tax=Halpernia frigidisoli TaxID=1125876 RepID=A0A1I3FDT5_9FLAO|nr:glycosyltransferase [Halpernia frigidisoli]SFI09061.1 Glycosyl transferases group 1 [Halpernia frigidisoli]